MHVWVGMDLLLIIMTRFITFSFCVTWPKVNFLGVNIMEILLFFKFKKLYCNYLPFRSPFMTLYYSSSLSWVDIYWSHESEDIYDFWLAIWVNTKNIGDFFTTNLCPLRDPMRALIGFGRCQIPSPDGPSCSIPIFTPTVLLHQLRIPGNTCVSGRWSVYTMSQRHGRYWRG